MLVSTQATQHALTTLEPAKDDGAIMNPLASWQNSTTIALASTMSFILVSVCALALHLG